MREYDLIADWFPTDRGRTVGVAEALAIAATLAVRSCILDVGCGNGVPVTEALVNAGYRVVGLDSSAGMLARFQANLPGASVVRGDAWRRPFVNGGGGGYGRWFGRHFIQVTCQRKRQSVQKLHISGQS